MNLAQQHDTPPKTDVNRNNHIVDVIDFGFDNRIQNGAIVLMVQQHNGGNRT